MQAGKGNSVPTSAFDRAQEWLDECIAEDRRRGMPDLSDRVSVAIGNGASGLYVGVTWLPGTVNGVSLTRNEASALSDLLMCAAAGIGRTEAS